MASRRFIRDMIENFEKGKMYGLLVFNAWALFLVENSTFNIYPDNKKRGCSCFRIA
jgi:hypothetical protein